MFNVFGIPSGSETQDQDDERDEQQSKEQQQGGGVFSFFEMAKEVAANVQKSGSEIVQSVAVTDWGKEIRDFGSALQQDTQEMVEDTKTIVNTSNENIAIALPKSKEEVQESMEILGNTIENFGKQILGGTTDLLTQMKETVNQELQAASIKHKQAKQEMKLKRSGGDGSAQSEEQSKKKRLEDKVNAMQRDSGTYCDEPEDYEYFEIWRSQFKLADYKGEVEETLKGNAFMVELQERIVPLIVDYETFWTQYFFRLHMIKLEEGMVAKVTEQDIQDEKMEGKAESEDGGDNHEEEEEEGDDACRDTAVEADVAQASQDSLDSPKSLDEDSSSPSGFSPVQAGSPRYAAHSRTPSGLLSEPDAATASDSSANDWINVKAKTKGSPNQSPKALESLNEQKLDEKKVIVEKEKEEPEEEEELEDLSPLKTPPGASSFADDVDDDDIDEDWGEM